MRVTLTRRWAVPAVAAAALSAGAGYAYARYTAQQRFIQWCDTAKPGQTRVDLSRPGTAVVPIPRSPGVHHPVRAFYLDPGGGTVPGGADWLKGVRGYVQVTDDKGEVVSRLPLGEADPARRPDPANQNRYPVGFTDSRPSDGYTVTITLETGSPDLTGAATTVYGRYALGKDEVLPAVLWWLLEWIAGIPAALLWVVAAVRWKGRSAARAPVGAIQAWEVAESRHAAMRLTETMKMGAGERVR